MTELISFLKHLILVYPEAGDLVELALRSWTDDGAEALTAIRKPRDKQIDDRFDRELDEWDEPSK